LASLAGVEVEEYYALVDPAPVIGNWFTGVSRLWAERLRVVEASITQVIARYGAYDGWLDDQIAITVRGFGSGLVYYVGAYLDDEAQRALVARMIQMSRARPELEAPEGVEVRRRWRADDSAVYIVVNHERAERVVTLPWTAHEHLSDTSLEEELVLSPYGVAILTRSE
jgi:beta-galactosidase